MEATEQYLPEILFILLPKVESYGVTIQMKASYCVSLYCAIQGGYNFESVDEILWCDHSNERY